MSRSRQRGSRETRSAPWRSIPCGSRGPSCCPAPLSDHETRTRGRTGLTARSQPRGGKPAMLAIVDSDTESWSSTEPAQASPDDLLTRVATGDQAAFSELYDVL